MQEMGTFLSLEGALSDRFRGHINRDFAEWREKHAYREANDIPADATRAWIGRQKLNFCGFGTRRALQHLISGNVDQPFLTRSANSRNSSDWSWNGRWWPKT